MEYYPGKAFTFLGKKVLSHSFPYIPASDNYVKAKTVAAILQLWEKC